ncbi:MAG: hypothetical protein LBH62_09420 [Nitrososphaerota archaeon]|jgi:hypothetical protein|uniref:hypothetical protein n=1 Tax=Candidatus Bathycorpusculum sp. TaxID=2994959 RepID=UPI00282AA4B1|nr:hypothetical protein [Candidatus Termiticorpusculum sp.]MCL2256707.1 hypothetical protein [Candidatus Termiticorpusculum sp.]MCL2293139.1 hypothetical protein [Candidatus Termiticorpusculum sp.]MDR0461618.1 hypothetical protein [Nitrososphaerota archaeon]
MVILNKKGFKLPRVEKEKFITLIRLGLEYDGQKMLFSVKSYNNINQLRNTLQDILKSEIAFTQTCTVCNVDFNCSTCKYVKACPTKDLPFSCVCNQCLRPKKNLQQQTLF